MFMYESTLTRRPLYSVSPHFRRIITGSLILKYTAERELDWFNIWLCVRVWDGICGQRCLREKAYEGGLTYSPCSMGRGLSGTNSRGITVSAGEPLGGITNCGGCGG